MARTERDGSPKGQSISVTIPSDVGVELVHGSMKALSIEPGDLVVVRLHSERYRERDTHRHVLELVEKLLVNTGRRATALVVPEDFDLELLPRSTAIKLLEEIVAKAEAG